MNWVTKFIERFFKEEEHTSKITYVFGEKEHVIFLLNYAQRELQVVDTSKFEIIKTSILISYDSCTLTWEVRPKFDEDPPPPPKIENKINDTPGRASS